MSIASKSFTNKSVLIKWAICIILTIICLVIPEQSFYTTQVKMFFAVTVFCLALSATELIPDFAIAILMPALWVFFKVSDFATVMSAWITPTMIMIAGAFVMAASLEHCGLLRRIAFYLMCKVNGNYFFLMLALMLVGILINILTFGAAFVIVPAIAVGLCASMNAIGTKFAAGLGAAAILGCATSHSYTYMAASWGVINTMGAEYLKNNLITPFDMMLHNWPMLIISIGILFIAYLMYRPKDGIGDLAYFRRQLDAMGKITQREKVNIAVLTLLILYVFTVQWTGLQMELGFAIIPFLLYLPGINGATEETLDKMNWKTLFFIASCMAIGTVATQLGLAEVLSELCLTLLNGNTNSMAIMAVVFAIVFLLNFLMTPMAIWSLLTVPLLSMAVNLGYNPVPFAYAVNACAEAILLPYEYVPYLVIYGFGLMRFKDFFVFNLVRSILVLGGIVVIMTGYWHLIGLF